MRDKTTIIDAQDCSPPKRPEMFCCVYWFMFNGRDSDNKPINQGFWVTAGLNERPEFVVEEHGHKPGFTLIRIPPELNK